jgi:hypothetical protein
LLPKNREKPAAEPPSEFYQQRQLGDFITQVDGVNVGAQDDFDAQVSRQGPGFTIRIGYMRSAWAFETKITVDRVRM